MDREKAALSPVHPGARVPAEHDHRHAASNLAFMAKTAGISTSILRPGFPVIGGMYPFQ